MERGKWADWLLSALGFVSLTHQRKRKGAWRSPGPFPNPLQLDLTQRALVIPEGTTETRKVNREGRTEAHRMAGEK